MTLSGPRGAGFRAAFAGAAATCSGNGLARFAYVPLFPAMVAAQWVDGGGAGLLGAINLSGYLLGTLAAASVAHRLGVPRALDLGMALIVVAVACCAWNGGLGWLVLWRGVAGIAGGVLMGLAGPAVQQVVAPQRRGLAGGVVIGGVAGGIVIASLAVPALLTLGLAQAWMGIALLILALWLVARPHWPDPPPAPRRGEAPPVAPQRLLVLAYALSGGGLVAPMVYLADLAARGRGLGVALGAGAWLLFGLGGMIGTLAGGAAVDRFGGGRAMIAWLVLQVLALGLLLLPWMPALVLGAALSGFVGVGVSTVVLGVARERAGAQSGLVWVRVTAGFAVTQALTGFGLAALFAATGESHAAVFGACLVLSAASLAAGFADQRRAGHVASQHEND